MLSLPYRGFSSAKTSAGRRLRSSKSPNCLASYSKRALVTCLAWSGTGSAQSRACDRRRPGLKSQPSRVTRHACREDPAARGEDELLWPFTRHLPRSAALQTLLRGASQMPPQPHSFPVPRPLSRLLIAFFLAFPLLRHLALAAPVSAAARAAEDPLMPHLMDLLPPVLRASVDTNDPGFFSAFLQSFLLILACELGDRTFFVAAILAMKSSRTVVFSGALAALAAMTVLSAAIGKAFPLLLDKRWTSLAAAVLFAFFGVQLLRDWWKMRGLEDAENEELAEVEEELKGDAKKAALVRAAGFTLISPVFVKAFTMTGLAEWGDRSQIATIALAASRDLYGVIVGGVLGHAICTGLAVVGGRLLATKISEKAVALTGGVLFLSFAVITASGKLD